VTKYDFIAIGGGNAGLTATSMAAAAGLRTALVDRGPVGGLCSLNGCNPKKVLVRSIEVLEFVRHADKFGIETGPSKIDWSRVIDRKESFTAAVTPATEASLMQQRIDLLRGAPHFLDRHAMHVSATDFEFGSALVSTGSTSRRITFPGSQFVKTSDDILALRRVPKDLVIIGAGVVAYEFGQVFARLGSRVTTLTPGKRALKEFDSDIVDALVQDSTRLGITLVTQSTVRSVRQGGDGLRVEYEAGGAHAIDADFVLNAAGRVPSIAELQLDKANVQSDKRGVTTSEFLRSISNRDVFAAGDVHGRLQLSPIASYEGRVVGRNLLENDTERADYSSIPRALYTIPQVAMVGMTEAEARDSGR
jgi:glutathione reductase (NADPH)